MKLSANDSKVGGFSPVSNGWHNTMVKAADFYAKEGEQPGSNFLVEFEVFDDEDEGKSVSMFCDGTKKFGRTKLARILGYTSLADELEKKYKLPASDLDAAAWGEKFLDHENTKSHKLYEAIKLGLPGLKLMVKVESAAGKAKDGAERTYTNVVELNFYSGSSTRQGKAGLKSVAKSAAPVQAEGFTAEETDEW